jgi:mono/diheme cytochrome c family protein
MTTSFRRLQFGSLLLVLAAALALSPAARGQEAGSQAKLKKVPVKQTGEVEGAKLFRQYCAVCHGLDGKGNGPATAALKLPPPDLTALAQSNGGKFPTDRVANVLANGTDYPAHGSKEMPIWGPLFSRMSANPSLGKLRVKNVTEYLQSIQAK